MRSRLSSSALPVPQSVPLARGMVATLMHPGDQALSARVAPAHAAHVTPPPPARGPHPVAPPRPGHLASLLVNGAPSWQARQALIASAEVLLVRTYAFHDDRIGKRLADLLRRRAEAGCTVLVMFDFKGTVGFAKSLFRKTMPDVLVRLALTPGVFVVPCFVPRGLRRSLLPCDHKKVFIALSRDRVATMVIGGMNLGERYQLGGKPSHSDDTVHPYRDTDLWLAGPVVADAVFDVLADLRQRAPQVVAPLATAIERAAPWAVYAPLHGGCTAQFIANSPEAGCGVDIIGEQFIAALAQTRSGETVYISNAYFVPTKPIRRAMAAAAQRGVRFELLLNGPHVHDWAARVCALAGRSLMRHLRRKCPQDAFVVHTFSPCPKVRLCALHQKVAQFGTAGKTLVGSWNMDSVSAEKDYEAAILIDDPAIAQQFMDAWHNDLGHPWVRRETSGHPLGPGRLLEMLVYRAFGARL